MTQTRFTQLWALRIHLFGRPSHTVYLQRRITSSFRMVIRARPGREEATITQYFEDLSSALLLARRHVRPVELWYADDHLCTVENIMGDGSTWAITPGADRLKARAQ